MTQKNSTFKAADIAQRFKSSCIQFDSLLASGKTQELTKIRQKLHDSLKEYKQQGALTVAFVGQYSAGKSTIISALTGRRDIYIDADIATDKIAFYDWNGIRIVDTPGLFTDRRDHDDITYDAIEKADLLVFCLTDMLFDSITVENFKKLAYDKGYRWKMMFVINKMSASAGEESQKISSYSHSLSEALKPYTLNEFSTCFIDAKDYCSSVDRDDDFSVKFAQRSRFSTFIEELNKFVERRSSLARIDTPVRIVLGCVDDAQIGFARNTNEDTAFLEILSRLSRRINKERERLRTRVKSIALEMASAVTNEGIYLASAVGDEDFKNLNKQSEINVRNHYEKAEKALEGAAEAAIQSIQNEVESELQSNLTHTFVAQLNCNKKIDIEVPDQSFASKQLGQQVTWLTGIAEKAGIQLTTSATRGFISTAKSGQAFLRPMDVAGSSLHQGVLQVGKVIGFKFKPWEAVGIAKNIGNAAMFLGPALAVISIGFDMHTMHQEHEHERKMADVRRDITSQFKAIAIDLEQQIEGQLREFEAQVYGQLEQNISKARQQTETAMATSNIELAQLATIRHEFELILQEVQRVATPSIL
jgi:hypothetical protein